MENEPLCSKILTIGTKCECHTINLIIQKIITTHFDNNLDGFNHVHLILVLITDLGLFSTRSLVDVNPSHAVEIRTQPFSIQDDTYGKRVWNFASQRSHSTIEKYAGYQAASFQDSLKVS